MFNRQSFNVMGRFSPSLLGSLFNVRSRPARLPILALRQLVTYYTQWRRSRDVMSSLDEQSGGPGQSRSQETLRTSAIHSAPTPQ